jgi:hypothetical protein
VKNLSKFLAELPNREGAYAIFIEPPIIAYIRVSNVHGDDWGARARIDVVPAPGMKDPESLTYEIGSGWDIFSNGNDHWHAIYVNWSLYFKPSQVKAGLELAAQAAAQGRQVELREMRTAMEELARVESPWP